jgi:hypothetical protein
LAQRPQVPDAPQAVPGTDPRPRQLASSTRQILTTRSLHRSGANARKDLTEQAEHLHQKADWPSPRDRTFLMQMCRRPRRFLSGRLRRNG